MNLSIKISKRLLNLLLVFCFALCSLSVYAEIDEEETYKQLGRKPSQNEMLAKDLDYNTKILNEELSIIVRGILAVGETPTQESVEKVKVYLGKPTPFYELKEDFEIWINQYGSIANALRLLNLNLSKEALFLKLIDIAVEEVYGNLYYSTENDKRKLADFYTSQGVSEYKPMVGKMVKNMTPEMKKRIITECLINNSRDDLIENKEFMAKMLAQDVSYTSLDKLFSKI